MMGLESCNNYVEQTQQKSSALTSCFILVSVIQSFGRNQKILHFTVQMQQAAPVAGVINVIKEIKHASNWEVCYYGTL